MADIIRELVAQTDPKSPTSEAVRCLRTNIQFLNAGKKNQIVVITSPLPQEGKTFIAANLAVVTAQSDKKTLLIDCDLRRPSVHKMFGVSNKKGLSTLLASDVAALDETSFVSTDIENLSILTSGPIPPNPAELLERKAMDNLLLKAREMFDMIYIDTSPLLSVTDPVIMSKKADGIILVVMADVTLEKVVTRAYSILKDAGVNMLGAVFNKLDTSGGGYYRYRYYRYSYGK